MDKKKIAQGYTLTLVSTVHKKKYLSDGTLIYKHLVNKVNNRSNNFGNHRQYVLDAYNYSIYLTMYLIHE